MAPNYRRAAPVPEPEPTPPLPRGELGPLLVVLWLASMVRSYLGWAHGESLGRELLLAAVMALVLPLVSVRELRDYISFRREVHAARKRVARVTRTL